MKVTKEGVRGPLLPVRARPERPLCFATHEGALEASRSPESVVAPHYPLVSINKPACEARKCRPSFSDPSAPCSPDTIGSKYPITSCPAEIQKINANTQQQHPCGIRMLRANRWATAEVRRQRDSTTEPGGEPAEAEETTTKSKPEETQNVTGQPGFSSLPSHLLAFILSSVGSQSAEKATLSHVCRRWKEVMRLHCMWSSVDASHRPLSSLSTAVGPSIQLRSLWRRTETLVLADDDAAEANELLLQLSNAPCSSSTASSISNPTSRVSSASRMCSYSDSSNSKLSSNSSRGMNEAEHATGPQCWTLPYLRHLRVHRSMGGGYIRHSTPQNILAAADAARGSYGLIPLHPGSSCPSSSSSSSSSSSNNNSSSSDSSSGLQQLEELVLETEVGPELLLALRGKTPRLKTLIISCLHDKPNSSSQERGQTAAAAVPTESVAAEVEGVSALEALLLLLEELPPQQLAVFGFGNSVGVSGGRRSASSDSSSNGSSRSSCGLPDGLEGLRERLQRKATQVGKEEALGDELCSVLAAKHHESLRALWMPDICTSLEGAGDLIFRCRHLTICSIPGAAVLQELHCMVGSRRPVESSSTPLDTLLFT